jgi:hypothetical protein
MLLAVGVSATSRSPPPSPLRRLNDLVQPPSVDVRVELHPQGEVIGELEAEGLAGQILAGKQLFDVGVVDEEVQGAAGQGDAPMGRSSADSQARYHQLGERPLLDVIRPQPLVEALPRLQAVLLVLASIFIGKLRDSLVANARVGRRHHGPMLGLQPPQRLQTNDLRTNGPVAGQDVAARSAPGESARSRRS